jgi:putative tricarboxylic transport membrane protein
MKTEQVAVGAGTLVLGGVIVVGAMDISSDAGYGGVGPNFLPWVVGLALLACGVALVWEAMSGGFRGLYDGDYGNADWKGFVWMSVGILLNALLITTIGFILSCTLCFVFAVCGLRSAEGRPDLRPRALLGYAAMGIAISAPVYWMFTKALAINLPGLTDTGWL